MFLSKASVGEIAMYTLLIMIAVSMSAIIIMIKVPSLRSAALIFAALPIVFICVSAVTALTIYFKSTEPPQVGKAEFADPVACVAGRTKLCCPHDYTWDTNNLKCRLAVAPTKPTTEITL